MNVRNLIAYWLYYTRDHRGRLFDVRRTSGSAANSLTRSLALRLAGWGTVLGFAVFFALRSWGFAASGGKAAMDSYRLVIGFVLFGGIVSAASLAAELPRERRRRAKVLAAQGRCGGCGYGLAEVEDEPDGCRVCPECGTAWQIA